MIALVLISTGHLSATHFTVPLWVKLICATAVALLGDGLRSSLTRRGEQGGRAWQAISELPEDDQRAALGYLVDDLEKEGFALYRIDEDGHG